MVYRHTLCSVVAAQTPGENRRPGPGDGRRAQVTDQLTADYREFATVWTHGFGAAQQPVSTPAHAALGLATATPTASIPPNPHHLPSPPGSKLCTGLDPHGGDAADQGGGPAYPRSSGTTTALVPLPDKTPAREKLGNEPAGFSGATRRLAAGRRGLGKPTVPNKEVVVNQSWRTVEAWVKEEAGRICQLRVHDTSGWWQEFVPREYLLHAMVMGLLVGGFVAFFWALVVAWLKWGD